MEDGGVRSGARNPILAAGSRLPPWATLAVMILLVACWMMGDMPDDLGALAHGTWWLALAFAVLAATPQRVELGADGMRVTWLGTPRVVRYDAVMRAAPVGDEDVFLMLRSGESLRLRSPFFSETDARAVLARIWSVLAAGAEDRVRPHERAALARGGRSVCDWTRSLAALTAPGAQYRQPISVERLFTIAANPAAPAELRAAAAVAAAATPALDEAARAELRDVAAQAADERLRAALAGVAGVAGGQTYADLERALATL